MIELQRIVSTCSLILTCVLLIKLYASGLTARYRFFSCYLLFEAICSLLLLLVKRGTTRYGTIWIFSKPLSWVLSLMVLLEIYTLVMGRYPGISTLMRWTVSAAAVASGAISILSLTLDFRNPNEAFPLLRCAFAVQRTVDATMALSLLIPLLFMLHFPVRLSRNAVVHCLLFSVLVGHEAGGLFVRNWLGQESTAITNLVMTGATMLCLLGWILFLNRQGEQTRQPVGPMCSPEMEQQMLDRLREFNEVLVKAGHAA